MSKRKVISASETVGGLARHPEIGFIIAVVALLLFTIVAYNVVTSGPLTAQDPGWTQAIHQVARHSSWVWALIAFGFSSFGRDGIALIALLAGIILIRQKRWREFSLLFMGVAVGEGIFQVLSNGFARHRPVFPDPFETLPGPGFPSGHALSAVALFSLCVYLWWPRLSSVRAKVAAVVAAVLLCLAIGASRLYLGDHYLTDIVGGYLMGIAWCAFIYTVVDRVFLLRRARRSTVIYDGKQVIAK